MGQKARRLKVQPSDRATGTLEDIWDWNAHRYGVEHANRYLQFLLDETDRLEIEYVFGKSVPNRRDIKYVVIKKSESRSSHGYIAVYRVTEDIVEIVDYFHTAQDWQNKLDRSNDAE